MTTQELYTSQLEVYLSNGNSWTKTTKTPEGLLEEKLEEAVFIPKAKIEAMTPNQIITALVKRQPDETSPVGRIVYVREDGSINISPQVRRVA